MWVRAEANKDEEDDYEQELEVDDEEVEEDNEGLIAVDDDDAQEDDEEAWIAPLEKKTTLAKTKSAETESDLNEDIDWLLSQAEYLPEENQIRYNKAIMKLVAKASNVMPMTTGQAASQIGPWSIQDRVDSAAVRQDQFHGSILKLINQHGFEKRFSTDTLVNFPLDEWNKLEAEISHPFTKEEIGLFCQNLDKEGKMR